MLTIIEKEKTKEVIGFGVRAATTCLDSIATLSFLSSFSSRKGHFLWYQRFDARISRNYINFMLSLLQYKTVYSRTYLITFSSQHEIRLGAKDIASEVGPCCM